MGRSLVRPNQINPKTAISESQDATGWREKKIATQQVTLDKNEIDSFSKNLLNVLFPKMCPDVKTLCFQPATSLEDKTEDFAGNPTRDALADGLMCMIKVDTLEFYFFNSY